jgi:hypothetical protein
MLEDVVGKDQIEAGIRVGDGLTEPDPTLVKQRVVDAGTTLKALKEAQAVVPSLLAAAYLELALRTGLPLATLDADLTKADGGQRTSANSVRPLPFSSRDWQLIVMPPN